PRFSSNRMLRQYVEEAYLPAATDHLARSANGAAVARELAAWEARVRAAWPGVRFEGVEAAFREDAPGLLRVEARVCLGGLAPADVRIELYADPDGAGGPAVRE